MGYQHMFTFVSPKPKRASMLRVLFYILSYRDINVSYI